MSNWNYGEGMDGLARLAKVGVAAIVVTALVLPAALIALCVWAFFHVSIR